ncbi:hypothetical protein BJX76DRAFT_356401 [Aspergillus varians]
MCSTAVADRQAIVQAYRHLYRQGLKAINYSTPARHLLVNTLRSSFRSLPAQQFDSHRITNTLDLLGKAADVSGIEHRIVKNLFMTKYWNQRSAKKGLRHLKGLGIDQKDPKLRKDAAEHFNRTLMLLNESLGTCLK